MDDFQISVLSRLSDFLAEHDHKILKASTPPQPFGNSFLQMQIDGVTVMFVSDRGDEFVRVGRPDDLDRFGSPKWLLVRVLESLKEMPEPRPVSDCDLLVQRFNAIQDALSDERFSETSALMEKNAKEIVNVWRSSIN